MLAIFKVWFSATLQYYVFVGGKPDIAAVSLIVFKSRNSFDYAHKKAIAIGFKNEEEYENENGVTVIWKLHSVETLDRLDRFMNDGREVYSKLSDVPHKDKGISIKSLDPRKEEPVQAGV